MGRSAQAKNRTHHERSVALARIVDSNDDDDVIKTSSSDENTICLSFSVIIPECLKRSC